LPPRSGSLATWRERETLILETLEMLEMLEGPDKAEGSENQQ